jgi:hypothetical protein
MHVGWAAGRQVVHAHLASQLSYRPDSLMYCCLLFNCKQLAVLLDHQTMYLVKMQFCACSSQ